jgi:hypothetical protein
MDINRDGQASQSNVPAGSQERKAGITVNTAIFWTGGVVPETSGHDWIMGRAEGSSSVASMAFGDNPAQLWVPGSRTVWVKEGQWQVATLRSLPRTLLWQGTKIAILAEEHLSFPEISRYLAGQGVKLFTVADEQPRTDYRSGLWREVQQNQVFGLSWYPEPCLLVPCEIDPSGQGVIPAISSKATWDWEGLQKAAAQFPIWSRMRTDLYRKYWWGNS